MIDIAFKDVQTRQEIAKERKSAMSVYRMIILMSFFVVTFFQSYMIVPPVSIVDISSSVYRNYRGTNWGRRRKEWFRVCHFVVVHSNFDV